MSQAGYDAPYHTTYPTPLETWGKKNTNTHTHVQERSVRDEKYYIHDTNVKR
jgi:hypothetical protein